MLQTPRSQQEPDIWNIKRDSVPIEFQPSISSIASTSNSNYRNENVTRKFYKNPYMIGVQSRFRRKFNEKFKSEKKVNPLFLALLLLIILLLTIAVIVLACYIPSESRICYSKECLLTSATFQQNMNFDVEPCNDFFEFTCGNFESEHPRSESQFSNDWFREKQAKVLRNIKYKLEMLSDENFNETDSSAIMKTQKLFESCMNTTNLNNVKYKPLFKFLEKLKLPLIPRMIFNDENLDENSTSTFDWIKSIVQIKRNLGVDNIIGFEIFTDPKNNTKKYLAIGSPSQESQLPLVDDTIFKRFKSRRRKSFESNYLESEEGSEEAENEIDKHSLAYAMLMKNSIMILAKNANPSYEFKNLDNIREAITASVEITRRIYSFIEVSENISKAEDSNGNLSDLVYIKISDLQKNIELDLPSTTDSPVSNLFEQYLNYLLEGIPGAEFSFEHDMIITSNPDMNYLKLVAKLISETPQVHLEMFLWWSTIEELLTYTTSEMRQLYHDYMKILGFDVTFERSTLCASSTNKLMGFSVSSLVVDEHFLNEVQPRVMRMVKSIQNSFEFLVEQSKWMDIETKERTLMKSSKMRTLIGFPEWILDKEKLNDFYKGLNIRNDSWLENIVEISSWTFMKDLSNWRMPLDDSNFTTVPTDVNAFYTFQDNAITIPLAILQFPFFQLGLEALEYGSFGSIIAHELTHGFDDVGRHFDEYGNKNFWWANTTIERFINKTECFKKQYSEYLLPEINEYIDGEKTLGENIADNQGIREAFYAFKHSTSNDEKRRKLPGFEKYSIEQLFFISYGNLWCETMTPVGLKFSLEDTHSPGKIRVLGVLSNFDEFHKAFNCHVGQKYHKTEDKRCTIW